MYDVIVVGGGVAGASTAMLLARRGRGVLLVDRPDPPGGGGRASVISAAGLLLLDRWGVLATLRADGTHEADALAVSSSSGTVRVLERTATVASPALGELLWEAARASGAEVRGRFTVKEVVWRDGRVVGVVGSEDDRHARYVEARFVVGADGRQSVVARAANAPVLRDDPSATCCYSTCWTGAAVPSAELHVGPGAVAALLPLPGGLTCVRVAVPVERWAHYKRNPEATYLSALSSLELLAARLAGAGRVERFFGTADMSACVRQGVGPGWVLVGDAARHAGGILSRGVGHALVQAELAAAALDGVLRGAPGGEDDLARYPAVADELLGPAEDLTTALTSCDRPAASIADVAAALSEVAAAQAQRVETLHSMGARGSGE